MAEGDPKKEKIIYGILAILLGGFGVHKFYMGHAKNGIFYLLLSCIMIGWILGIITGVMALIKTDEEFHQKYVVEESFL